MTTTELTQLYEEDGTAWLDTMALLIKERRLNMLDYQNLESFLMDLAIRDRRELWSQLVVLLAHKLKWDFQAANRSNNWRCTIKEQRRRLRLILRSKTLQHYAQEIFPSVYPDAVEEAADETGKTLEAFPATCPYSLEQLLAEPL